MLAKGFTAIPQMKKNPFHPRSLRYGCWQKSFIAHWATLNYSRISYNLFATKSGILFNHESPYKREEVCNRKITDAVSLK